MKIKSLLVFLFCGIALSGFAQPRYVGRFFGDGAGITNVGAGVSLVQFTGGTNALNTALTTRMDSGTNDLSTVLKARMDAGTNGLNTALTAKMAAGTNDLNTALKTRMDAGTNDLSTVLKARMDAGTNTLNTALKTRMDDGTNTLNTALVAKIATSAADLEVSESWKRQTGSANGSNWANIATSDKQDTLPFSPETNNAVQVIAGNGIKVSVNAASGRVFTVSTGAYSSPTNAQVGVVIDMINPDSTTNMTGNLTFTGVAWMTTTNRESKCLHLRPSGADRIVTLPASWITSTGARSLTITNTSAYAETWLTVGGVQGDRTNATWQHFY